MKKLLVILIIVQIINVLVFTAGGYMFFSMKANQTIATNQPIAQQAGYYFINDTPSGLKAIADELSGINSGLSSVSSDLGSISGDLRSGLNSIQMGLDMIDMTIRNK